MIMKQKNTRLDRNENAFSENGFSLYSILYKSIYVFWNFTIYYLVYKKKEYKYKIVAVSISVYTFVVFDRNIDFVHK